MGKRKTTKFYYLVVTLLVGLSYFALPLTIRATTLNPSSGTYGPGSVVTINITATPQAGENAVALRIQGAGLTITGYTPPTGWTVTTPDCAGSTYFTATNVCASLGKTTAISSGQSLGVITVRLGTSGGATLTGLAGNAYSDGTDTRAVTGQLASFTIDPDLPATLPITDSNSTITNIFILAVGMSLLFLGASLVIRRETNIQVVQ
jgi:hypothetical protein